MAKTLSTDDGTGIDENVNSAVLTPNAPMDNNNNVDENTIAYDANGNAQFATIGADELVIDDKNNNSDDNAVADNDAAAAAESGGVEEVVNNNGESFKNSGNNDRKKAVYNGNNDIGEGVNNNNNNNNNNGQVSRLPPWFESTGNPSVDYKLARSRCCCCSLRAGIEVLSLSTILIGIWDLLISAQFAEEETLVNLLSLYRILGGICGFFGAWKYHKNASKFFIFFWITDMLSTLILLIWSISLINNCNNDYDEDDDDWGWWYADCKYKYENFTIIYTIMFLSELYFIIIARRFHRLMAEI